MNFFIKIMPETGSIMLVSSVKKIEHASSISNKIIWTFKSMLHTSGKVKINQTYFSAIVM